MSQLNLTEFINKRTKIVESLTIISTVAEALNVHSLKEELIHTIENLLEDLFNVVVVGEFNRGKSTFINALLGKRILPSAMKPTTTILSKISYSSSPIFRLVYRDGKQKREITEETFKNIVAPIEPSPNDSSAVEFFNNQLRGIQNIAFAEIGYPSTFCEGGVEIVDTPGTNDLDAAREEITYQFIPSSDAAIMILSAVQQLSMSEKLFLKERILSSDIQKVFFVINQKDRLKSSEDQLKVMNFVRGNLSDILKEPRIFLVSAKQALQAKRAQNGEEINGQSIDIMESGFHEFEQDLASFLTNERGYIKLAKPIERGIHLAHELQSNSIRLLKASVGVQLSQLQEQVNNVRPQLLLAQKDMDETVERLKTDLMAAGMEVQKEYRTGLQLIADLAINAVDNYYTGKLEKEDISAYLERRIAPLQTELQERIQMRTRELVLESSQRAERRFAQSMLKLEQTLDQSLSLPLSKPGEPVTIESEVRFDTNEVYLQTGLGAFGIFIVGSLLASSFAFPLAFIGGGFLYSYFESKAREKVLAEVRVQVDRRYRDTIKGSLQSFQIQWDNSIKLVINHCSSETTRKVQIIEQQLEEILQLSRQEEEVVEQKKRFLENQELVLKENIQILSDIREELKSRVSNFDVRDDSVEL